MARRSLGLMGRLALESEDNLVAGSTNGEASTADAAPIVDEGGAGNLEQAVAEVNDTDADLNANAEQVEAAVTDVGELNKIADTLEVAAANGGLDADGLAVAKVAVEGIVARLGGRQVVFPSMESVGGAGQGKAAGTRLALEDTKEKIKEIWGKILAKIEAMFAWLKEHFYKVFGSAERMQKRAQALAKKADEIKGTAKSPKIESDRLVKALHVSGAVDTAKVIAAFDEAAGETAHQFGAAADAAITQTEAAVAGLKANDATDKVVENFVWPAYAANGGEWVRNPASIGAEAPKEGLALWRGVELPGGKAVLARVNKEALKGAAGFEAFLGQGIGIAPFNPKAAEVTKKDLATLSPADMSKLANAVATIAGHLAEYRSREEKFDKVKKDLQSTAKALQGKSESQQLARFAFGLARIADRPQADLATYLANTGRDALHWIEESMKQYGESVAKEPEDKNAKK